MNRFFILLFVFFTTAATALAQFTPKTKGISSFARFNNTETFFVLPERVEMESAMITAAAENWTITKSHVISKDSFLLISKDRSKSFVYIHKMKTKGNSKKIEVLALVNGGYDDMSTYISNTLAYVSIDNNGYEVNQLEVVYRLPNIVHQLENIVKDVMENNIVVNSEDKVRAKMIKNYNKKANLLKNKILLVDKRYLNQKIISQKEFLNVYKYEVVFVDKEAITTAIREKDSSYAYLVSALNLYKINTVTDCETGNIIFADFEQEDKFTQDFDRNFSRDDIVELNAFAKSGK